MNKRILFGCICVAVLGLAGWQTAGLLPPAITGMVTAGTNVTVTGSGTLPSPYVVSATGAGSSYPFTFIQESQDNSGATSTASYTVTFPQHLAASGATAWLVVGTDGTQTVTTPAGWTVDINQPQATYSRLMVLHKTSAGDTNATFTVSSSTGFSSWFFELSGTRTLDQSSVSGVANTTTIALPSITPTAGSLVFGFASLVTSAVSFPVTGSPWRQLFNSSTATGNTGRGYAGEVSLNAAQNVATTPPLLNLAGTTLFSGGGVAYATFSIK